MGFLGFFWLCRAACGILVPRPRIEAAPPALEACSLNHRTTREVLPIVFVRQAEMAGGDQHHNNGGPWKNKVAGITPVASRKQRVPKPVPLARL